MKKFACLSLFFFFFATLQAEEINVDSLISAHQAGLSSDTIIKLVSDPNNTTATFTEGDLERLKTAGVPQSVIDAFTQKATQTAAPVARPDNESLYALVKLVESGLSEKIIIDQINQAGVSQKPTMVDLIFLKEKKVPEIVIVALMNARISDEPVAETPSPEAASEKVKAEKTAAANEESKASFDGLIYKKAFFGYSGKLVIEDGKLLWRDAKKGKNSFDMYLNGISKITLVGTPQDAEVFYFRVVIDFTRGQDYVFEDANKEVGGNENITAFINHMKAHYPDIEYVEKAK